MWNSNLVVCLLVCCLILSCAQPISDKNSNSSTNFAAQLTSRNSEVAKCKLTGACCNASEVETICYNAALSGSVQAGPQVNLTLQLDACGTATDLKYITRTFNDMGTYMEVTIKETPFPTKPDDIQATTVTLPDAQARWSDISSTGSDDVSYDSPLAAQGTPFFLYYRRDIFQKHSLLPPSTWEELLEAAEKLNGTDMDGRRGGDYALCFGGGPYCDAHYVLLTILAPMMQAGDAVKGVVLEPEDMSVMVNNVAMRRALEVYSKMVGFTHPGSMAACDSFDERMAAGQCAMTINRRQFPLSRFHKSKVAGKMGTVGMPGSEVVLNRKTGQLVPCTFELCPHALPKSNNATVLVNRAPLFTPMRNVLTMRATGDIASRIAVAAFQGYYASSYFENFIRPLLVAVGMDSATTTTATNSTTITAASSMRSATMRTSSTPATNTSGPPAINTSTFTPSSGGNETVGDGAEAETELQEMWRLVMMSASNGSSTTALTAPSELVVFNTVGMAKMGFNKRDADEFLPQFCGDYLHKNKAYDLLVPGASYLRLILAEGAVLSTTPNANLTSIMLTMETKFRWVMDAFGNTPAIQKIYWSNIDFDPPAPAPHNQQLLTLNKGGKNNNMDNKILVGALTSSLILAALLVCVPLLLCKGKKRMRYLLKPAPGVQPSTTLLITDIQNSTMMWEKLPEALMAEVLRVHHKVLRGLLDKHHGYESATEGDSFILAFPHPSEALAYAVEAQEALLGADWPHPLMTDFDEAMEVRATVVEDSSARISYSVRELQAASSSSSKLVKPRSLLSTFQALMRDVSLTNPKDGRSLWQRLLHCCACCCRLRPWSTHAESALQFAFSSDLEWDPSESELPTGADSSDTFGGALSKAWDCFAAPPHDLESGNAPPGTTIWRGLRVRMGIHSCGSQDMEAIHNRSSHRTQYSGSFASTAKYVADAGHGGQIVLSQSAFSMLNEVDKESGPCLMRMGEHVLENNKPTQPLYQATVPGLEARLQSFPPLRTKREMVSGVMQAPVGMSTVVFMNAIGMHTLLAWNSAVTRQGIQLYHSTVSLLVPRFNGYIVEMVDGLCLVAFQQPEDAIAWALHSQAELMTAAWPVELLKHELCEPITTMVALTMEGDKVDHVSKPNSHGLRLKVGIASGPVLDSLAATTGAMGYRGKVMNRAARISSAATTGQVLCMCECWHNALDAPLLKSEGVSATSAGLFSLKGIEEEVELYICTHTTKSHTELKAIRSAPTPSPSQEGEDDLHDAHEPLDQLGRVLRPSTTWAPGRRRRRSELDTQEEGEEQEEVIEDWRSTTSGLKVPLHSPLLRPPSQ